MRHNLFVKLFSLLVSLFGFSAASAEEAAVEGAIAAEETVAQAATSVGSINVSGFLDTLPIMAEGLLGIFTVMCAIWILIWGLCRIGKVLAK